MYIVINTLNSKSAIIKAKIDLSEYIKCSISTIQRREAESVWSFEHFKIYKPSVVKLVGKKRGKSL